MQGTINGYGERTGNCNLTVPYKYFTEDGPAFNHQSRLKRATCRDLWMR